MSFTPSTFLVALATATMMLTSTAAIAQQAPEPSKQMEELLSSPNSLQRGFINNAIVMISVVAAQTEPQISDCLNQWYFKSDIQEKRNAEVVSTMKAYVSYRPETVILAVVEKACGKFKRPE